MLACPNCRRMIPMGAMTHSCGWVGVVSRDVSPGESGYVTQATGKNWVRKLREMLSLQSVVSPQEQRRERLDWQEEWERLDRMARAAGLHSATCTCELCWPIRVKDPGWSQREREPGED